MSSDSAEIDVQTRQKLAARIVTIGPIAIAVLSVVIVGAAAFTNAGTGLKESTQLVFTAVLPLVGTWVGTVLAFYFAKENFEAASRATKEILGIDEKLKSILVSTVMIPISKIDAFKLGECLRNIRRHRLVRHQIHLQMQLFQLVCGGWSYRGNARPSNVPHIMKLSEEILEE